MAAYEVLLLNTAIPQIQAAQSGDTYVVPRDIAFSTVANLANGTYLLPALAFSSDSDTGIFRQGANALGFTAGGGADQMVLTTTGLGIGTSSPAVKLQVYNNINGTPFAWGNATRTGYLYQDQNGVGITNSSGTGFDEGVYLDTANSKVILYTNSTDRVTLDSSGNLGLGVTPSAWNTSARCLDVLTYGGFFSENGYYGRTGVANNAFLKVSTSDTYLYKTNSSAQLYDQKASTGEHRWFTAPSGTANSTTIVSGNEYTIVTAGGNFTAFGAANNNVGTVFTATSSGTATGGAATQTIVFTQAMTLDASGNLGVGTTNPVARLTLIQGSGNCLRMASNETNNTFKYSVIKNIPYNNNALGNQIIGAKSDSTYTEICVGGGVDGGYAATELRFFTAANTTTADGTERARITSGGEFLVGTANAAGTSGVGVALNPSSNGVRVVSAETTNAAETFSMYSTGASAYRFYVDWSGKVNATNTTIAAISDQRLKENVRDLDDGLGAIMALKPRKFDWKAGKGKDIKDDRGFIAQEFEQVFPDMIDNWKDPAPEGEEPYKAVRADLIPVLVKAIQEQQAMINELKAEVAALKGA